MAHLREVVAEFGGALVKAAVAARKEDVPPSTQRSRL